jgi:hypothetical protein
MAVKHINIFHSKTFKIFFIFGTQADHLATLVFASQHLVAFHKEANSFRVNMPFVPPSLKGSPSLLRFMPQGCFALIDRPGADFTKLLVGRKVFG